MLEPDFEYDAPMIYDFTRSDNDDLDADRWFDEMSQTRQQPLITPTIVQPTTVEPERNETVSSQNEERQKPPNNNIIKPYNLRSKRKRPVNCDDESNENKKGKFVSMAAEIQRFEKATPLRFRSKSRRELNKGPQRRRVQEKHCCIPHSPKLLTRTRARVLHSESTAEKEEKEVKDMKSRPFKATALNPKIIEKCGLYGVPPKSKVRVTVTAPFKFTGKYQNPSDTKEELLQLDNKELQKKRAFKATPMPDLTSPFIPKHPDEPEVTRKQEFQLQTEMRGKEKVKAWMEQLKSEMAEERSKREFKAIPSRAVHEPPFEPQHKPKPLHVQNVILNTDVRAKQRQELAEQKRQMDAEKEEVEKKRAAEREQKEKEKLKEMRQQMVHQAQPMPEFKPFVVHPSSQPPTVPKAPHFHTEGRVKGDISQLQNDTEHF